MCDAESTYTGVLCTPQVHPESHLSSEAAKYWSVGDAFVLNKQNGDTYRRIWMIILCLILYYFPIILKLSTPVV